ncbi:hypothetical protein [Colwellia sp. E2M01]|uniref:hypothetical protein n=1 Tax=Colwellia sp. E2M01 TaxID=2841561 RepID=UPI001C08E39A|nr:hypothetical protein [Colwellia sp. E2M01]MBU2871212.1 hypothetical protein [Colwellia sp. E2M01]
MKKLLTGLALSATLLASTANAGLFESFIPTDTDGFQDQSGAFLFVEYGEFFTSNGISHSWYLTDTNTNSVVDTMDIFGPSDDLFAGTTVSWDFANQTATSSSSTNGFDWSGLSGNLELGAAFSYNGDTIYSHDSLNPGNADLVDIEQISFAGFNLEASFSDTVGSFFGLPLYAGQSVAISNVAAGGTFQEVSAPTTLAIFGLGLLGLARVARRQS